MTLRAFRRTGGYPNVIQLRGQAIGPRGDKRSRSSQQRSHLPILKCCSRPISQCGYAKLMRTNMPMFLGLLLFAVVAVAPAVATGQNFPDRAVRVIVPYTPG